MFCWWVFVSSWCLFFFCQSVQVDLKGRSSTGNCQPGLNVGKCCFSGTQRQQETVGSIEICFPEGIISVRK